jgi:hypothetical protein
MLEVCLLYPQKWTSELAFNLVAPATFATLAAIPRTSDYCTFHVVGSFGGFPQSHLPVCQW